MEYRIKVDKDSGDRIIIESSSELREPLLNFLLMEGYKLLEILKTGRSVNSAFNLEDPEIKNFYLIFLKKEDEPNIISKVANSISKHFKGQLRNFEEYYLITLNEV